MRFILAKAIIITAVALTSTGCASIISESRYPVTILSNPPGATYKVVSQDGFLVQSGQTPDQVMLDAGAGYFDGEEYIVMYSKKGYTPTNQPWSSQLDGWYWGNIVFGGVIGMLIVDPATGAMFKLPEGISAELTETPKKSST